MGAEETGGMRLCSVQVYLDIVVRDLWLLTSMIATAGVFDLRARAARLNTRSNDCLYVALEYVRAGGMWVLPILPPTH